MPPWEPRSVESSTDTQSREGPHAAWWTSHQPTPRRGRDAMPRHNYHTRNTQTVLNQQRPLWTTTCTHICTQSLGTNNPVKIFVRLIPTCNLITVSTTKQDTKMTGAINRARSETSCYLTTSETRSQSWRTLQIEVKTSSLTKLVFWLRKSNWRIYLIQTSLHNTTPLMNLFNYSWMVL